MSCFQVHPNHIRAMLRSALALGRLDRSPFAYYHGNPSKSVRVEDEIERVGQMLWEANARSVYTRYPDTHVLPEYGSMVPELPEGYSWDDGGLPIRIREVSRLTADQIEARLMAVRVPTPVETLKLCACFDYQACETSDWEQTEACAFVRALERAAIRNLPGYEQAPWEWK